MSNAGPRACEVLRASAKGLGFKGERRETEAERRRDPDRANWRPWAGAGRLRARVLKEPLLVCILLKSAPLFLFFKSLSLTI